MKRAALGALLISLVAGSTAFAGTFIPQGHNDSRRHEQRQDHRRDNNHRNNHRNDGRHGRDDRRWDGRHDNDRRGHENRRDDHRWNDGRRDDRRWDDRRHDSRHDYRYDHRWDGKRYDRRFDRGRWHWGTYHRPHGYVHRHWVRGNRLPHAYYASHYVIRDYYGCGLRRPPYGYHWVRVNHDAVLAVIATGVILDVVYNQFW